MRISTRYGSHMPVLLQALKKTDGKILELGGGVFSTPLIHWICRIESREAVTYENYPEWYEFIKVYQSKYHQVELIKEWTNQGSMDLWDVVLIDLTPDEKRKEMAKQFVQNAKYVILHDSNGRYNKIYHYETIYPLYRHMWTFDEVEPSTTVLSNFYGVKDFIK